MDWNSVKQFLKPDWRKVAIFVILMGGLNYFIISTTDVLDARILVGLPLGFWPKGSFYVLSGGPIPPTVEFSSINFIIDIIFWYLISCVIVLFIVKLKRNKSSE